MNVTAAGIVSLPMYYAQQTLAASATLQGLFDVSTAADAAKHILMGESDEHADTDIRPRVLLDVLDGFSFEKTSNTAFLGDGTVEAVLELPAPPDLQGDANFRTGRLWFYNQVGLILTDCQPLFGTPGYLNVLNFSITSIGRADPKENDGEEFFVAVLDLKWQG